MPDNTTFELTVQITETQAWDLAQFLKRAGFSDFMSCAVDKDEAYRMIDAANAVRRALRDAGFNPR
jgi:hypothetical protein